MRSSLPIALLSVLTILNPARSLAQAATQVSPLPSLAQPAIAPGGKEIAFVSGGDIWSVPMGGGEAHLLVSDPADESRPLYSPDGSKLAFVSTRTGAGDIYILTFATGEVTRLTYSDSPDNLDGWSRDGEWLYFTSSANDVQGQSDIFRVRATGGTPLEVSRERYLNEFESSPSPDGKQIALIAKGISNSQWWRDGHAHIDETELWLKPVNGASTTDAGYHRLLTTDAKHAWPMWAPDGKALFVMSDKSGSENIWRVEAATGTAKQLTTFTSGRCLWPTVSYDGKEIVFERNFAIWKMETGSGKAEQVKIVLRGSANQTGSEHARVANWSGLSLSPDGKKIAVTGHGEIFAASLKDGGEAQRLTHTPSAEGDPMWSSDSTRVVYRSERDGGSSLYEYDLATNVEKALTHGVTEDMNPTYSPDGKMLAFMRDRKELHVMTLATMKDTLLAHGDLDDSTLAWSPDSQWVAFVPTGANGFANIHVVPAAGGEDRPITFLANGETASKIAWSPDGKYILFDTSQRAETPQLARVDLIPHVPAFREDQFRDLFQKQSTPGAPSTTPPGTRPGTTPSPATPNPATPTNPTTPTTTPSTPTDTPAEPATPPTTEPLVPEKKPDTPATPATPAAPATRTTPGAPAAGRGAIRGAGGAPAEKKPEPTKIVFEGIRERLTLLPLGLGVSEPVISPDGKTLLFSAEVAGQENLYVYSLDELSREQPTPRQLTSTPGSKGDYTFTPDSREIVYLESGAGGSGVRTISVDTRAPRPLALTGSIEVDFNQEKKVVFDELWSTLNHRFFDANFNGKDWAALKKQWEPYIAGAKNDVELRRDENLLIGELNSSHSGTSKAGAISVRVGRLGLRYEREPFEQGHGLIVREVVPLGPAAIEGSIKVGDRLMAVNGTDIAAATNLDQVLEDAAGRRTVVTIAPGNDPVKKKDVVLRPVTQAVEAGLLYRAWVDERRAYVEKISGGKLGYVHLAAMGDDNLAQLYLDLDAQNESKQGVVVDVRNNNGGYVNGRVIDVFARKNYLLMYPRGSSQVWPTRQSLGQRALGVPTVLVTNESTLSDGEDFTEGYRTLGLGKVVGVPTAGWIIFTGSQRLIDGSTVRTPSFRIRDTRGQDMEMHPRPVDVLAERPLGETESGKDAQLEKAVQTLMAELPKK